MSSVLPIKERMTTALCQMFYQQSRRFYFIYHFVCVVLFYYLVGISRNTIICNC